MLIIDHLGKYNLTKEESIITQLEETFKEWVTEVRKDVTGTNYIQLRMLAESVRARAGITTRFSVNSQRYMLDNLFHAGIKSLLLSYPKGTLPVIDLEMALKEYIFDNEDMPLGLQIAICCMVIISMYELRS